MHLRVVLRAPGGETVIRDVDHSHWAEPEGSPERLIGGDLWALPGLVDAHAHLAAETLDFAPGDIDGAVRRTTQALRSGVGLVLDKGWRDLTTVELMDRLQPAERPDIEAAGAIYAVEGGYWGDVARNIPPGGIATAVVEGAGEGRGWVKLIGDWPRKGIGPVSNFTEEELVTAVEVATRLGVSVAIHTMARDIPSMAVRAGVHSIEHGLFLSPNDLNALGDRGGTWVPTVLRVEAVIQQLGADSSGGRLLREGFDNIVSNLGPAVEAGVRVLTGTDLVVGTDQVAQEAIRLWELGMDPRAVVDAVSASGFRATGRPAEFEIGSPANAVLFAEDPTQDPRALAHPQRVIRLGRTTG
jgi:imidazolonepropionase-like amidohydrolase